MAKRQVFVLRDDVKRHLIRVRSSIDSLLNEDYSIEPADNLFPLLFRLYSFAWRFGCRGFYKKVWKDIV